MDCSTIWPLGVDPCANRWNLNSLPPCLVVVERGPSLPLVGVTLTNICCVSRSRDQRFR